MSRGTRRQGRARTSLRRCRLRAPPPRSAGSARRAPHRAGRTSAPNRSPLRRNGRCVRRRACAAHEQHRSRNGQRRAKRAERLARTAVHEWRERQHRVHREIPREQQEHRRREQVDRLRAADAIHRDAEHESAGDDGMPTHGRHSSARVARTNRASRSPMRSSASVARRPTNCSGDACSPTTSAAARLAHARSASVHSSRATLAGFQRAHRGHVESRSFVHRRRILRGRDEVPRRFRRGRSPGSCRRPRRP